MAYTYVHNATLIDGHGGPPVKDAAVLIENETIRAAGPRAQVARPAGDVTDVDARGGFILPGLIDTHVHLMFENPNFLGMLNEPPSLAYYKAIGSMRRTIEAGVTTVRDAGGTDLGMKMAVERGLVEGPRMQISITILTITGGHADFTMRAGVNIVTQSTFAAACDGPDEVRKKVREVLRAGADVIKVCSTGGVLSPTDDPNFTQFTPEELDVIVQEGRYRRNVPVMAHAQGTEGIKNAIRAGVRSIEHGIYLDDEAIELMIERGTFLVPTLVAPIGVLEAAERTGSMPDYAVRKSREALEAHRASIAKAYQAGVKIAMGTDAGVVPHGTNLRELGLMCDVGMTPMDALTATTKVAAECLGWQDRVGTVEAGKLADLVISRTDPIKDIRSLEQVENVAVVMKGGRLVKNLLAVGETATAVAPALVAGL
ncbi:MAG: amidohydrolase family protein [Acidobacteriota bacterium]|nr:amidohydrolase family protein [Acidobacteriota bacterium]